MPRPAITKPGQIVSPTHRHRSPCPARRTPSSFRRDHPHSYRKTPFLDLPAAALPTSCTFGQRVTRSTLAPPLGSRAELAEIANELAKIARSGEVLPGSIGQRHTGCGRPSCSGHKDPPHLHGPYYQWTRKLAAKTVGRWLSAEQAGEYRSCVENDHRIRELLGRLEAIGLAVLEADPRTRHGGCPAGHGR